MSEPLIGRRLANFVIERVLGHGGMAEVYFGRDVKLQRPVAIKVIDARYRNNPAYATRFVNEARAVASWRHENIVQVYYADQDDDLYYFVMEYIDGMDLASLLRQYVDEGEYMPHADVLKIGRAVARALDYAHSKGVIHRDVKPSNVMISVDDRVILMDFGLALDVQQGSMGEVFGSPHYISPEQARRSADAVPSSDLYSLGVMLYEMLTGAVPFDDPSPASLALQHLALPPPPPRSINPSLNEQTEQVLLKALSKEPQQRYPSAVALLDSLEESLSQPVQPTSTAELPPMPAGLETSSRSISSRTVSERLALYARSNKTEFMPDPPRIPATEESKRVTAPPTPEPISGQLTHISQPPASTSPKRSVMSIALAAILLIAVAAVVVIAVVAGGNRDAQTVAEIPSTATNTAQTHVIEPSATPQTDQAAQVVSVPTDTPAPMLTSTDTLAPPTAILATDTQAASLPTDTSVSPTATPMPPTQTPIPPTNTVALAVPDAAAQPTILYPNGRRVEFVWNDDSFYWHNPQSASIMVSNIRFEAIDASGQPVGFGLSGERWAWVGYNRVESGKCAAIEINRAAGWMRPSLCRDYNSIVNTPRDSEFVFWTLRDGMSQFRVLWDNQEIGRCDITAAACEVYLP